MTVQVWLQSRRAVFALAAWAGLLAAPAVADMGVDTRPARTARLDGSPARFLFCDQPGGAIVVGIAVGRRVIEAGPALDGRTATLDPRRCEPPESARPSVQCSVGAPPVITYVDVRLANRARRLGHGIFGERWEYSSLRLRLLSGVDAVSWVDHEIGLPADEYFEDRSVRHILAAGTASSDACGMGFLVIQSHVRDGAALVLYALAPLTGLTPQVVSDPLGTPALWRDVIGVADVVGDGRLRVVEVVEPHGRGRLQLNEVRNRRFEPGAGLEGYSSHRLGTPRQGIGALLDLTEDGAAEIVVPTGDWKCLAFVSAGSGELRETGRWCSESPIVDVVAGDLDGNGRKDLLLVRADGTLAAWTR